MRLRRALSDADPISRRTFVSGLASGLFGLSSLPLFANAAHALEEDAIPLQPATARRVIYLFMSGGMSHLDTFDTKPGAETQGPTESIATSADGVRISQHFPELARHMDKVAVINSVTSNQGAHEQGRYYVHTSYELRGTIRHPSLGAWLTRMRGKDNPTLPGHVAVGADGLASAGFLSSAHVPLPIGDPEAGLKNAGRAERVDAETFARRRERVEAMNRAFGERHDTRRVRAYGDMYDQAIRLMSSSDLEAFDVSREPEAVRAAYGSGRFGQGCLLARRLVEHGTRFVEVVSGGWDTHNDNFERMEELCPPVDRALAALLADLEARGLLEETLVVLATEFGRTPEIVTERNGGRNHHPKAFSCLLAGGGIRGGIKYGATDERGEDVVADPVGVQDFNATIACALGLPLEHQLISPAGRPFTVANKGVPVRALFA